MDVVSKWLGRILAFLPQLIGLWNAAESGDDKAELEAQLDLVKAMKRQQAIEAARR